MRTLRAAADRSVRLQPDCVAFASFSIVCATRASISAGFYTVCMVALDSASTDALSPRFLRDVRMFLDDAFAGAFTDDDWAHAQGGMHVWLVGSRGLISHGSLVERTLICSNHTMRVGYVEAVATAEAHRREGLRHDHHEAPR